MGGACACCADGEGGTCRVASCYLTTNVFCKCVGKQVTHSLCKTVAPGDYPGWPGWDWDNDEKLRNQLKDLQTGDILLSCSKHPYGEYARLLANSKWDHVAIVVRHRPRNRGEARNLEEDFAKWPRARSYHVPSNAELDRDYDYSEPTGDALLDVELLESTGQGVHVYSLVKRLRDDPEMRDRYAIMAHRPVRVVRSPAMLDKLEDFIAKVRGAPFEQCKDELQSSIMRKKTSEENWSSMFCSELSAECFQQMGLLSEDRHSNEYIPCDFSSENATWGVKLIGGAEWGPETIIKAPNELKGAE